MLGCIDNWKIATQKKRVNMFSNIFNEIHQLSEQNKNSISAPRKKFNEFKFLIFFSFAFLLCELAENSFHIHVNKSSIHFRLKEVWATLSIIESNYFCQPTQILIKLFLFCLRLKNKIKLDVVAALKYNIIIWWNTSKNSILKYQPNFIIIIKLIS